ncbi:CBO0543 family protein [Halalkalibacter sp. AB-rgal2]|uniref:CBO0543 family protein n=1 Tax=Halalkalibacter sp. AB-rgal2 TaxID=3242695 RepID=UPI00359DE157
MKQKHLGFILVMIFINVFLRTWKTFPEYYKSLLYVAFINSCYYYLFKRRLLWDFNPGEFNIYVLRALHLFIGTPLLVLSCLAYFPKTLSKQTIYILTWTLGSTCIEYIASKSKLITYHNGWNIFWSCFIYFKMYTFSYLFQLRPILTWGLSTISLIFYMIRFQVPLETRFLKGPILLWLQKNIQPYTQINRLIKKGFIS